MSAHQTTARSPLRTGLTILVVVAMVLGLGLALRPLFGGDDQAERPGASAVTAAPDGASSVAAAAAQDEALPIETYQIFLVRDPFSPVRPAEAGTTGGATGGTTGDTTGTTGDTTGTTGDTTGTTGETTGTTGDVPGCSQQGEVVCDGRVVSLVDVFDDGNGVATARIQVDSELFDVQDGAVFATNFEVLGIDPPCVTLLFGDDAFTLCEGDRVLK